MVKVVGIEKYIGPEIINDFQSRVKWVTECNCPVEAAVEFQSYRNERSGGRAGLERAQAEIREDFLGERV